MAVVHHHVAAQRPGGVVVDAARPVRDVAHNHTLDACESLDNVDDRAAVHEQPLGHLQRHPRRSVLGNLRDRLGQLKVVVRREEVRDRSEQEWVHRRCRRELGRRRERARARAADEALAGGVHRSDDLRFFDLDEFDRMQFYFSFFPRLWYAAHPPPRSHAPHGGHGHSGGDEKLGREKVDRQTTGWTAGPVRTGSFRGGQ